VSKNISTYSRFGRYVTINQEYCFINITTQYFMYMRYDRLQQSFKYVLKK